MSSVWPYPVWPEEVEVQTDISPSEWILPRLLPSFLTTGDAMPVAALVPSGFPAYVRVLHPANARGAEPSLSWREIAGLNGRIYHPLMQFHQIREPDPDAIGYQDFTEPSTGNLSPEQCAALYTTMATWTTTPEKCWLGIWEGWGTLYAPSGGSVALAQSRPRRRGRQRSQVEDHDPERARFIASWEAAAETIRLAPHFEHPDRSYILAKSPYRTICGLDRWPLGITPSLVWPDDRTWCVASEIDFDSTLVAASRECADAVLNDERLEVVEVQAEDNLASDGDVLNPPADL